MGMDVIGKHPVSERGEYFRNNVWWWRPLWNYCEHVAPELCADVSGHMNDGDGLDADGARRLAETLFFEIDSGRTEEYRTAYYARLSRLPRKQCEYCGGTGVRTDQVGVDNGMPEQVLEPEMQALVGRERGWCNACQGEGKVDHWDTNYPFEVENVREFAEFLAESGGFQIF